MKTVQEQDLIFDVEAAVRVEKFDDNKIHGTKSSMKRVDFIIEHDDEVLFLEVKDPDMPGAANPEQLVGELQSGKLIADLAQKFRDSLLFSNMRGNHTKAIKYVVLLSMASLDDALVLSRVDALKASIPLSHKSWKQDCASSCLMLKMDAYKKVFGDESVWRESDFE